MLGERKLVTVMFADISGFTALADCDDHDPLTYPGAAVKESPPPRPARASPDRPSAGRWPCPASVPTWNPPPALVQRE